MSRDSSLSDTHHVPRPGVDAGRRHTDKGRSEGSPGTLPPLRGPPGGPFPEPDHRWGRTIPRVRRGAGPTPCSDRKSTRLNSSHVSISYAVFCLKKTTYDI